MDKSSIYKCILTMGIITLAFWPIDLLASTQDFMRNTGKIYVVVSVIAVIFVGLAIYLIYLERRIKTLENKLDDES